jgi:soluble lytic murein transglycosylase-like protein
VAGDLFDLAGEPERAAKALLTLARRERDHRDAPHAHLKAAEVLLAHGKSSEAAKIAQRFPGRWSRRRVAWRARWLRAWATFRAGDAEPAARLLAAIASARSAPAQERRRARYWSARMAEARSRERAIRAYEELVRDEPQSFYADLAQGRLQALGVQGHAPMAVPIPVEPGSPPLSSAAEATGPPPPPAARGLDRVLLARLEKLVRKLGEDLPDLPRALTLYQVGLWAEAREALTLAQEELEKARLRPPRQRAFASTSPPNDPQSPAGQRRRRLVRIDRAAFALALAPVFEKLGAPEHAQMNRRRFARAQEGRRARKQGPYPRAYEDLIQGASRAHGVSPALIFAVVRQESSFRTDALSPAGARGLLQIMPRTARRIAERLAETVDLKLLDDPAFSARYGAWYFQQLLEKYRGQVPLAIAAYNAGPRAVSRWLDARGSLPLDAFLEEIPFTETRRYVRKVIASARAYAQILGGKPGYYAQAHLDARYGDNIDF